MAETPTRFNLSELESEGMISVYVNGKFTWQLPKKLLSMRVPKAIEDGTMRWEIQDFSQEAFRLFSGWLYHPRGQLKEPTSGSSINPYLELAKLANRYNIETLVPIVNKTVQQIFDSPENMSSMGELYDGLDAQSPDRASISARFAALVTGKQMDVQTLKPLLKSSDLVRDMLIWVTIYHQHGSEHEEFNEILNWMGNNYQLWLDAHDEAGI